MIWLPTRLGSLLTLEYGKALPRIARIETGTVPVAGSNGTDGFHDTALVQGPGIVVGRKGSAGKVSWFEDDFWPIDTTYFVQHDPGVTNIRWLYYLLLSKKLERLSKSTGVPGLNRNDVYAESCLLPSPKEQSRIVELLDEADRLRRLRREADAKAARILPALFLKMFGDPATNPMGWPIKPLGELLNTMRNGTTADQNTNGKGYPVTRIETISAGVINPRRVRYVDMTLEEAARWLLQRGDILFSHINSESHIGKTAIYQGTPEYLVHGMNLLLLRPDFTRVDSMYLFALLNTQEARTFYRSRCKRAVNQASLNQKDIGSLPVPLPPLQAQKDFGALSHQVETALGRESIAAEKLDQLFELMLKRALSGQLTAKWREAHMKELLAEMEQQARLLNLPLPVEQGAIP
jgi:type I restriction enzyme S subunit